jgi:hypothetical protein
LTEISALFLNRSPARAALFSDHGVSHFVSISRQAALCLFVVLSAELALAFESRRELQKCFCYRFMPDRAFWRGLAVILSLIVGQLKGANQQKALKFHGI